MPDAVTCPALVGTRRDACVIDPEAEVHRLFTIVGPRLRQPTGSTHKSKIACGSVVYRCNVLHTQSKYALVSLLSLYCPRMPTTPLQWQPANLAIMAPVGVLEGAVWANADVAAITAWPWRRSAFSRDLVKHFRRYVRVHRHMATRRRWVIGRRFGWRKAAFDTEQMRYHVERTYALLPGQMS